jgi:hypothetical protein
MPHHLLLNGFLLGLLYDPEDGDYVFLQSVCLQTTRFYISEDRTLEYASCAFIFSIFLRHKMYINSGLRRMLCNFIK